MFKLFYCLCDYSFLFFYIIGEASLSETLSLFQTNFLQPVEQLIKQNQDIDLKIQSVRFLSNACMLNPFI